MRGLCIAFSMFSKFPVPQFEWKERDMKYMLVFFPLVGIVIGAAIYLWFYLCTVFAVERAFFVLIGTALPVLISGGIHVDGYMDTMDALHSYQSREKKLEILKDAHIGAFSVIMLLVYYLLYIGAYFQVNGQTAVLLLGTGFWLSRILSGLSIVNFPCAKKEGLASQFGSGSNKRVVTILLFLQLFICAAVLLTLSVRCGGMILCACGLLLLWYDRKCRKEFGGITGDTAGYFTVLCEGAVMAAAAAGCVFKLVA